MENVNQAMEQLKPLLTQVAEKIGQGAGFSWEVVMKQQIVTAVGNFIGAFVCMLIAIVLLILTRYFFKEWMKEIETENICFNDVPTVFIGFFAFIFIIFSFIFIYDGMAHLINPAYYSLEFFINLVK